MSRHGLLAKIAEAAAERDRDLREKGSIGPEAFATDRKLLEEAAAGGGEKKAVPKKTPERPANSLFYRLYPQAEKDDATEKPRRYWSVDGGEEVEETPLPSDTVMSGAFEALKFVSGGSGSSGGGGGGSSKAGPSSGSNAAAGGAAVAAATSTPAAAASSSACAAEAAPAVAGPASEDAETLKRKLLDALFAEEMAGGGSGSGAHAQASEALKEGATIEIFGLKGMPELNGQKGKLQHLDATTGRWQVDIEGTGLKKLKPDNLKVVQSEAPQGNERAQVEPESKAKKARTTFL